MSRYFIYQDFNTEPKNIISKVPKVKEQGFDFLQTSPIQNHKDNNSDWWILKYQPTDFKIKDREGLTALCTESRKYGLKVIADVVCNHVANAQQHSWDNQNRFIPSEQVIPEIRCRKDFFHDDKFDVNEHSNRYEVTHGIIGMPDLNTSNHELQDMIIRYLNDLIGCGIQGLRFDAMKHIELPDDAWGGSDFWTRVLSQVFHRNEMFIYGEALDIDTETIKRYQEYLMVGTNSDNDANQSKTVRWCLSHDDDNTFGRNLTANDKNVILNEFEWFVSNHRDCNILFYCPQGMDWWSDSRIKEIISKYR